MNRKCEFFSKNKRKSYKETAVMIPKKLYSQERDWTCSIACLRSITSTLKDIGTEDFLVDIYKLKPGPYYSKDIKELNILQGFCVEYGCDSNKDYELEKLYCLLKENYFVMVESMINYDHWLVLLSYFPNNSTDISKHNLLLYDPYFNEIKIYRAEEFGAMWISGDHNKNNITMDYIAIKYTEE